MDEYTCCYGPYAKTTFKCTRSIPQRSKKTAFVERNKNLVTKRGFTLLSASIRQFFAFSSIVELWTSSIYTTALKLYHLTFVLCSDCLTIYEVFKFAILCPAYKSCKLQQNSLLLHFTQLWSFGNGLATRSNEVKKNFLNTFIFMVIP